jgi:hypothetical protein
MDSVSYVLPEEVCQMWLVHPKTAKIIHEKYQRHTKPYIHNLRNRITSLQEDMKEYDYSFEGHFTGLEWYQCLERVYDEYLQPNLCDDNDNSKNFEQLKILSVCLMNSRHYSTLFNLPGCICFSTNKKNCWTHCNSIFSGGIRYRR